MHDTAPARPAQPLDVAVLDALRDAIAVLSGDGEITCANDAWCRLADSAGTGFFGARPGTLLPALCETAGAGGDASQSELGAALRSLLAGEVPELAIDCQTGAEDGRGWYRLTGRCRPDGGLVVQATDITDLKRMEARLVRERQVAASAHDALCEAVDSMSEGFALYDQDGCLEFCNEHYESFYRPVAELIRPGVEFRKLAGAAVAAGLFPEAVGCEAEWLRRRLTLLSSGDAELENVLSDGRWVRARTRRTARGSRVAILTDITELKRREERLKASEARFRHFAEAGSERLWELDSDLRFSFYSAPRDDVSGTLGETSIGKTVLEVAEVEGTLDRNWRQHWEDLDAHRPFRRFRFSRPVKGVLRHFRSSGLPVFGEAGEFLGYRGTVADETEEVEARLRAERAEEHLRTAVEAIPYGFVIRDHDDRLVLCNARYREIYGLSEELVRPGTSLEAALRAGLAERRYPDAVGREEEWLAERLRKHRQPGGAWEQRFQDRILLVEEVPMADGGVVGTRIDITEVKRGAERAIQSERLQALGTLAGGIAHDFNNLLAAMIGYAELVLDEPDLKQDARDSLEQVLSAGRKAKDLVKQILRFSRFTDDGAAEPCRMGKIAEEVLGILRPAIHPDVQLFLDVRSPDADVLAIPAHLSQIVMNLTMNAAQSIGQRPGQVEVLVEEIEVDEEFAAQHPPLSCGRCVRLTVRDTGPGMEESLMRHIFEPFFTTKEVGQGTGMGLSVVHGIVGKYDGTITVYSEVGVGSVFRVFLPLVADGPSQPRDCPAKQPVVAGRAGNALLVDDDATVRGACAALLARLGYCVLEFADAQSALECLRNEPDGISLVVTDQVMPNMSGQELATAIRETSPDLPILLCTGYGHGLDEERLAALGETSVLVKPFTLRELSAALDGLLCRCPEPGTTEKERKWQTSL